MARMRATKIRSRHLILGLMCTIAFGAFISSARAAVVGVNADITWGIPSTAVSQEISLIKQAGITWVRASVDLSGAEYYGPGSLNMGYLSGVDHAIQAAHTAGLNVLMEFDRTPYWASADPHKYSDSSGYHYNHYWKYADPQEYANVVSDLVNHYKGMGVQTYEIWNEPNNSSFWPSGVSASDYTSYLKAAYPAVKAADPSATVVMGGLMNQGSYTFLQGMYDTGARGSYDIANFHVYPAGDPGQCTAGSDGRPAENSLCLLQGLRSEMSANSDPVPVWVTELGWSACTQSFCVSQQQQATYLASAYRQLGGSSYAWVKNAFVYQMRDLYTETSNYGWQSSLGITNRDFSLKPAYTTMQAIATGSTASVPGPTVSLTNPTANSTIANSVSAAATASDPAGVTKVTFAIDGKAMATDTSTPYLATLGTKKLVPGSHTLSVTAYDADGLTATSSVLVQKGASASATAASGGLSRLRLTIALQPSKAHAAHRALMAVGRLLRVASNPVTSRYVTLTVLKLVSGSWVSWRTQRAPVARSGHYRAALRVARGLWRVRGDCRNASSSSRTVAIR